MSITVLVDSNSNEIIVNEKSTLGIVVDFEDEDGNAVAPSSATWTLTDNNGNVINNRQDEAISPAASVTIVLSGDDLQITTDELSSGMVLRRLLVEGVYTSNLGNDLPLKESCFFSIRNLAAVS
jgi:hypothetical protein